MKFKYQARTKDGELQVGFITAASKEGAVNILTSHNLFILSLESAEVVHWYGNILNIFKKVNLTDLMIFTRQFATLLESKVPLNDSLKNLHKQTKNKILQEVIFEIASDIDSGLSLSKALERQNKVFSEFYISMIRSAEITGRLEEAVNYLADYLEKQRMWRSKTINALIYPAFLILGFVAVVILLVTIVLPNIKPVFEESNVYLPWYTRTIFGVGTFFVNWWWAIILIIIPAIFLIIDYFKTDEGKIVLDEILFRVPILGGMFKRMYVARFADSLSVLIKGGIPIAQAIEITAHSIGSYIYRDILHNVSESVRGGELLSSALNKSSDYFPSLVGQMVAIGEATGRLEELLFKVSSFYTREVEDLMNRLGELIQPIVIAFIGIFIGLLFASILIPIYNLIQGFKV